MTKFFKKLFKKPENSESQSSKPESKNLTEQNISNFFDVLQGENIQVSVLSGVKIVKSEDGKVKEITLKQNPNSNSLIGLKRESDGSFRYFSKNEDGSLKQFEDRKSQGFSPEDEIAKENFFQVLKNISSAINLYSFRDVDFKEDGGEEYVVGKNFDLQEALNYNLAKTPAASAAASSVESASNLPENQR